MSTVTALDFRNEVFTAFAAFWADRTQIAAPNVYFDPEGVTGNSYTRLYVLGDPSGERRYSHSVARNHFGRSGTFTIEVYVREHTDTDDAYTLIEAATSWLESPGTANATFLTIGTPVEIGLVDGWFMVSITSTWLYFTDRAA